MILFILSALTLSQSTSIHASAPLNKPIQLTFKTTNGITSSSHDALEALRAARVNTAALAIMLNGQNILTIWSAPELTSPIRPDKLPTQNLCTVIEEIEKRLLAIEEQERAEIEKRLSSLTVERARLAQRKAVALAQQEELNKRSKYDKEIVQIHVPK